MNAKSNKRALKAGALAAALVAVLLPTGCNTTGTGPTATIVPPPGAAGQQVPAPMHTDP